MAQQISVPHDTLKRIIVEGDAEALVMQAKTVGSDLRRDLTTNQIRAIFSTVRQIDMSWRTDNQKDGNAQRRLILLKPKMLYRAAKEGHRGQSLRSLADILSEAIDMVVD
jgi:CRISPR-associated protein Csm2